MENLCDTCKTNCLDKLQHAKVNTWIAECQFYTDKEMSPYPHKCNKCKKPRLTYTIVGNEVKEHDSCLGVLPGVISACCGHGEHDGHILFSNNTMVRFRDTIAGG